MMPVRFEAQHLDYAYANGPLVVRDVSITSTAGTMTAVIGANGSGKSTLIRMLAGLLRPRAGKILLEGIPFEDWQPRLRAREIAYVPQVHRDRVPVSGNRHGAERAHSAHTALPLRKRRRFGESDAGSRNRRGRASCRQELHQPFRRRAPDGDPGARTGPGTAAVAAG